MLTALVQSLSILVAAILLLVEFYVPEPQQQQQLSASVATNARLMVMFCYSVDGNDSYVRLAWGVLVWTSLLMASISSLLLTHLCGFHIFLGYFFLFFFI